MGKCALLNRFRHGGATLAALRVLLAALVSSAVLDACAGAEPARTERLDITSAAADTETTIAPPAPAETPRFEIRHVGGPWSALPAAAPPAVRPAAKVREPAARATPAPSAPVAAIREAPAPTLAPGEGPTRPGQGRYTFHNSGTRQSGASGPQSVDDDGTLDVAFSGDNETTTSRTSSSSSQSEFRFQADGVYLLRTTSQTPFGNFEERFEPAQRTLAWPLAVGATWSGTYRSEQYQTTGNYKFDVLRRENVEVLGRSLDTFVIRSRITASGQVSGNVDSTAWWSPELGMTVKRTSDVDGSYGAFPYKSHTEYVLTGTP